MVVVTGAAGFIGSVFLWELNQRGITDILVVDKLEDGEKWKNISKRQIQDCVAPDKFLEILSTPQSKNFDVIFHLGACSSTTEKNMDFLLENNFRFSKTIFDWATENQKRMIYASSGATYGDGSLGFDDETPSENLRPLNPYGYSKVLFDRYFENSSSRPNQCVGLKYFNVYGPNEYHKGSMASMVYKAFHQIQTKGSVKLFKSRNADYEDGMQLRDFVYVKDVTRWMLELYEKPEVSGIFNFGFGKARTWVDLVSASFNSLKKEKKIDWIDIPDSIKDQYQYFTEAKMNKWEALGFSKPKWSLEEGVSDYYSYLLKPDPYL